MKHNFDFNITILFSIFIILFTSCDAQEGEDNNSLKDSTKTYSGMIVKENFVDKGGRVHEDIFDYYFKTEQGEIFIKIADGHVSRNELAKYVNKEVKVKAKLIIFGLWDTNDPNVQSRVGDYFIFYEIID